MAPDRLTDEQRRAAGSLDRTVTLTAGAGTGKTTTLTARYLELFERSIRRATDRPSGDGAGDGPMPDLRPRNVLTTTFTERAANDLQESVRAGIADRIDAVDPGAFGAWRTVADELESGYVHTLHGFCARLLREHALRVEAVEPGFETLDEDEAAALLEDAVGTVLADHETHEATRTLARRFSRRRLRGVIVDLVGERPESLDWADRWATATEAEYVEFVESTLHPVDAADAAETLADPEFVAAARTLAGIVEDPPAIDTGGTAWERAEGVVERLPEGFDDGVPSREKRAAVTDLGTHLTTADGERYAGYAGAATRWDGHPRKAEFDDAVRRLVDALDPEAYAVDVDLAAEANAFPLVRSLARLTTLAAEEYADRKARRNAVDFTDQVTYAVDFLRDEANADVRRRLREQFEHVLVDEAQDTDPRQWDLVELLTTGPGDGPAFADGNVFVVGDAKQSIYRFRNADVARFREATRTLDAGGGTGSGPGGTGSGPGGTDSGAGGTDSGAGGTDPEADRTDSGADRSDSGADRSDPEADRSDSGADGTDPEADGTDPEAGRTGTGAAGGRTGPTPADEGPTDPGDRSGKGATGGETTGEEPADGRATGAGATGAGDDQLSTNFRTLPTVLECVDELFESVFEADGEPYEAAPQSLTPARADPADLGSVEYLAVPTDPRLRARRFGDYDAFADADPDHDAELEAMALAARLSRMLAEPRRVYPEDDDAGHPEDDDAGHPEDDDAGHPEDDDAGHPDRSLDGPGRAADDPDRAVENADGAAGDADSGGEAPDSTAPAPAPRDVEPSDVAVLLRSRTHLEAYERAFEDAGVPYTVASGVGFYDAPEVTALVNLLRALADPADERALYATLRSPLFGFTDDTLARLAAGGDSLWAALAGSDRDRVADAHDSLREWRALAGLGDAPAGLGGTAAESRDTGGDGDTPAVLAGSWGAYLTRILEETGYLVSVGADERPRQAMANVEKFRERLRAHGEDGVRSLATLVRRIERRIDAGSREGEADAEADGVQVLTVHDAKGTEYPVVAVPGVGREFNDEAALGRGAVEFERVDGEYAVGTRAPSPEDPFETVDTLARRTLRERRRAEQRAEEKRVLYVACTRARDHLLLSGLHDVDADVDADADDGGPPTLTDLADADPEAATSWRDWVQPELLDGAVREALREDDRVRRAYGDGEYVASLPAPPAAPPDPGGEADPAVELSAAPPDRDVRFRLSATDLAALRGGHGGLRVDGATGVARFERSAGADTPEDRHGEGATATTGDEGTAATARGEGATTGGEGTAGGDPAGPTAGRSGVDPKLFGEMVHRICELRPPESEWPALMERTVAGHASTGELTPAVRTRVGEHARRGIEYVDGLAASATVEGRYDELPVTAAFDRGEVSGYVDHLLVTPETYHVVDYKTGRVAPGELAADVRYYREQMAAYAVALHQQGTGRGVRVSLVFTDPDETRTVEWSPADLRSMAGDLERDLLDRLPTG